MDDARAMRRLERVGDLARDRQRLGDGDGAARDDLRQVFAFDELHHQRARRALFLDAVNRADAGMVERGERLGFAREAGDAIGIEGERIGQDLDRDVPSESRVARPIDFSHAAGPQLGEDLVGRETRAGSNRHGAGA